MKKILLLGLGLLLCSTSAFGAVATQGVSMRATNGVARNPTLIDPVVTGAELSIESGAAIRATAGDLNIGADTPTDHVNFIGIMTGDGSGLTNLPSSGGSTNFYSSLGTNEYYQRWNIAAWGDSLTFGFGIQPQSYPLKLSKLTGRTVFNGGINGETSTEIRNRAIASSNSFMRSWTSIIWAGRNTLTPDINDTNTVLQDINRMVTNATSGRFFVLGIVNYTNEYAGTVSHAKITNFNGMLSAIFTNRFIDVRTFLVGQTNGTAPDEADRALDRPPASVRLDAIHLNEVGTAYLATYVARQISLLETNYSEPPVVGTDLLRSLRWQPAFGPVNVVATNSSVPSFSVVNTNGNAVFEMRNQDPFKTGIYENLFMGVGAGAVLTSGHQNIGIGNTALSKVTSGLGNVAVGKASAFNLTTGTENISVGASSMFANTSGSQNTAIGTSALEKNVTSFASVAVGYHALEKSLALENTAVGAFSMVSNTSGFYNVALGSYSLWGNESGAGNIAIGRNAGYQVSAFTLSTNDDYNIYIGYDATKSDTLYGTKITNSIAIGKGAKITASNQMQIGGGGATGVVNVATFGTVSANNGFLVSSNSFSTIPTLAEGQNWYFSSNGVAHVRRRLGGANTDIQIGSGGSGSPGGSSGQVQFNNAGSFAGDTGFTFDSGTDTVVVGGNVEANAFVGGGADLTGLNGSEITSGTVPPGQLGSGSSIATKFLRGDSTWQPISGGSSPAYANTVPIVRNTNSTDASLMYANDEPAAWIDSSGLGTIYLRDKGGGGWSANFGPSSGIKFRTSGDFDVRVGASDGAAVLMFQVNSGGAAITANNGTRAFNVTDTQIGATNPDWPNGAFLFYDSSASIIRATNSPVFTGMTLTGNLSVGGGFIGLGAGVTNAAGFGMAGTNETRAVTYTNGASLFSGNYRAPTNGVSSGTWSTLGGLYLTNVTGGNVTLGAFADVPVNVAWSIPFFVTNGDTSVHDLIFPAGTRVNGTSIAPARYTVTNATALFGQVMGIGNLVTNVSAPNATGL